MLILMVIGRFSGYTQAVENYFLVINSTPPTLFNQDPCNMTKCLNAYYICAHRI